MTDTIVLSDGCEAEHSPAANPVCDHNPADEVAAAKAAAPTLPRRIAVRCPRCSDRIELNTTSTTRLTFTSGSGSKGWITCEVGVSAIEHRCAADRA